MTRNEDIAKAVIDARRKAGMSAPKLAEATGGAITHATLANLESGRKKSLGVDELIAIAEALGVPAISLIYPHPNDDALRFCGYPLDRFYPDDRTAYTAFWDMQVALSNARAHDEAGNTAAADEARKQAAQAKWWVDNG